MVSRKVYPRVGGGNAEYPGKGRVAHGLSPRGRGKQCADTVRAGWGGSIPAWAGETYRRAEDLGLAQVYPRVGGGNR